MRRVSLNFEVRGADTPEEAIEMVTDYFCGGAFYRQVRQKETIVSEEIRLVQESEASEA